MPIYCCQYSNTFEYMEEHLTGDFNIDYYIYQSDFVDWSRTATNGEEYPDINNLFEDDPPNFTFTSERNKAERR